MTAFFAKFLRASAKLEFALAAEDVDVDDDVDDIEEPGGVETLPLEYTGDAEESKRGFFDDGEFPFFVVAVGFRPAKEKKEKYFASTNERKKERKRL